MKGGGGAGAPCRPSARVVHQADTGRTGARCEWSCPRARAIAMAGGEFGATILSAGLVASACLRPSFSACWLVGVDTGCLVGLLTGLLAGLLVAMQVVRLLGLLLVLRVRLLACCWRRYWLPCWLACLGLGLLVVVLFFVIFACWLACCRAFPRGAMRREPSCQAA